jgi:hypothetical protein
MVNINKKIYKEIELYCELNNIKDITFFVNKIVVNGFNIEKYGMLKTGKDVEVEKKEVELISEPINKSEPEIKIEPKKIIEKQDIILNTNESDDDDRYNELYDRL